MRALAHIAPKENPGARDGAAGASHFIETNDASINISQAVATQ
jgi:hypothetical protein